ncbi:phosphoglycerate dehydrogenase [Bordetella ansorpii]|uniref:Phosphoglycerate dehydrogenase n=1 Tax=Bordetella ansorpii TaxID=288768 RepID=A0A157RMW9_9BORD|nr:hydroxyacid dehydrogenase [Bordetella ansorpii]SAI59234.1 phosphoglycerate dehydrogenase [Bordetella ansorpii]
MPTCVIAQPIHAIAARLLSEAGIEPVQAAGTDLAALRQAIVCADAVIVRDALPAPVMDLAPRLCVIANHGTGTDKIDVRHATAQGIPVVFTPDANVRSVAEHALMLMLATARQAAQADAASRAGNWRFKYEQPMQSLHGKTLGIIGLGKTGRLLCEMAGQGLRMRTLAWSPSLPADAPLPPGIERADTLADLLRQADVVSLHRPLRADTRHTLNADAIALMKPGAIVVNTSRGGLIDEPALADALRDGRLFGAGLDVFADEPLPAQSVLAGLANTVLTPHVAGSTQEALMATASGCVAQIIEVLSGQRPAHLADPSVWAGRRLPASPLLQV